MQLERRFVLVDFTHPSDTKSLRYEAGHTYSMPSAVAHAAAKRELVAKKRPPNWKPPSTFAPPEMLTQANVAEAVSELRALQRQCLGLIDRNTTG